MALGDLVSRVLVEMRGDTSDLKAKIKDLQGVEKDRAKQLLGDIERTNKGYQGAIDMLGKVGLAIDTVGKFTDFARSSLRAYGEHMRLTTATAGINIDRLSTAFRGLVREHDLLVFAAQTSKGVLALNQGQMETLGQAAVALTHRGFDLEDALKKLQDAAVKGKVGGLDDLGLSIEEGSSKAETLRNMMRELNKVIAESGSVTRNQADDVQRASKQMDDMIESLKRYTAQAFLAMDTERMIKDTRDAILREGYTIGGFTFDTFDSVFYTAFDRGRDRERFNQARARFAEGIERGRQKVRDSEVIEFDDGMNFSGDREKRADARRKRAEAERKRSGQVAKDRTDLLVADLEAEGYGVSAVTDISTINVPEIAIGVDDLSAALSRLNAVSYEEYRAEKQKSFLEGTFGELEDFNAYATAFDMLTGSVSAGLNAWIDGSMSAGQAIRKFLADALKGLATSMAVEALKHGAYAIGSLAFGDVRGATTHAAAAAAFGLGATAAAVAAKELGGSASTPSKGAGSSSGAGGGGSGGGGGGSGGERADGPRIIVIGNHFDELSPRQRALEAERAVRKVTGGSGSSDD